MAVTLETAARNAACNAVVDLLDAAGAVLEIKTSAGTSTKGNGEVATLPMSAPAFGAAANGVATAGAITDDADAAGGTAAKFYLYDNANAPILSGTVTATGGGGDIELSSVSVGAGDTVSITSLTVTMPAS